MDFFHLVIKKVVSLQRFLSLRPVVVKATASKRFHKFWFLVLENPGFGWGFLVVCVSCHLVENKKSCNPLVAALFVAHSGIESYSTIRRYK